jgi:hypothetical protein
LIDCRDSPDYNYSIVKYLILAVLMAVTQTPSPIPPKALDSHTATGQTVTNNPKSDKAPSTQPPTSVGTSVADQQHVGSTTKSEDTQQAIRVRELPRVSITKDWSDWGIWAFNGLLVIVGAFQLLVLWRQAKIMKAQAEIMAEHAAHLKGLVTAAEDNAKAASAAAEAASKNADFSKLNAEATSQNAIAAKASADALIASERAWIDGELVSSRDLGICRYSLRIRNLGKTPAQIRSYKVSTGPIGEDESFSPDNLPTEKTINLHIFIGSGEVEPLEERINMDEIFLASDSICMGKGPYCVVIKYADVVTGTPENRVERETSFVYLYSPFLQSVERLSVFNRYS